MGTPSERIGQNLQMIRLIYRIEVFGCGQIIRVPLKVVGVCLILTFTSGNRVMVVCLVEI